MAGYYRWYNCALVLEHVASKTCGIVPETAPADKMGVAVKVQCCSLGGFSERAPARICRERSNARFLRFAFGHLARQTALSKMSNTSTVTKKAKSAAAAGAAATAYIALITLLLLWCSAAEAARRPRRARSSLGARPSGPISLH